MINTISQAVPFLVLAFHLFLVVAFLALIFRKTWGKALVEWAGERSLVLGLIVAIIAVVGSLFYSNLVGFPPCDLCWWQRIALYPLLVLFIVAVSDKDRGVFKYVLPLSLIGLIFAVYHSYVQWGGASLIPCGVTASCDKLYVYAFSYITIPTMSLTIAGAMILIWWANKMHENRNA